MTKANPQNQKLPELRRALEAAVVTAGGAADSELRRRVLDGGEVPAALATYIEKVRRHAYRVTDEDVAALRAAGFSAPAIFELTAAAAVGAAAERLDAGLRALDQAMEARDAAARG